MNYVHERPAWVFVFDAQGEAANLFTVLETVGGLRVRYQDRSRMGVGVAGIPRSSSGICEYLESGICIRLK